MSTVAYALGRPRAAVSRGGDCRARDLDQERHIYGPHRFATTTDCQINNGMIRVTVKASGVAPALTIEAWRGRVVVDDFVSDTVSDTVPGSYSVPAWFSVGTITIDSPSVSALLTGVRLVRVNPEVVTIRLVAPLMADAFVSLHRGCRSIRIQHGDTRGTPVDIDRRVRLTDTVAPVGTAVIGRVEETTPAITSFPRWVAALDPVTANAGQFSLTASSAVSARFGAGVSTNGDRDTPLWGHRELGNASRPQLVVV